MMGIYEPIKVVEDDRYDDDYYGDDEETTNNKKRRGGGLLLLGGDNNNNNGNGNGVVVVNNNNNHSTTTSTSKIYPVIRIDRGHNGGGGVAGGGGGGDVDELPLRMISSSHNKSKSNASNLNNVLAHHHHQQQQHHFNSSSRNQQQRLVSLDVFRGLTVALMIVVDDAGGILPCINHSPWNGVTLADFVMPFFLFIVGLSLPLAYKKLSNKVVATKKATFRALKLLLLGLFLQGGFIHSFGHLTYGVDIEQMRWMGILQRIAVAYALSAVCEIWLKRDDDNNVKSGLSLLRKYRYQWAVASVIAIIYLSLVYGLYVPDWQYQIPSGTLSTAPKIFSVKCGVRGDTGPACNAVGMIDRKILGIQHLYKRPIYSRTKQCSINSPDYGPLPPNAPSWCQAPFDPEGLLSSVMAIVTCLVGLHFGHIIIHFKDHKDRILHWMIASAIFVVAGLGLDLFGMHLNKVLFTFSYMCVTAGVAGFVFVGIYLMVDVYGCRRTTLVIEWMGMHALTIYILAACNILPLLLQGFYWRRPQNNILRLIGIGA